MYKCDNCGHLFEEGEAATKRVRVGECWGEPCSEDVPECPVCGGDFSEAKRCKVCDEYFGVEDKEDEICEDCKIEIQKKFTDFINNLETAEKEYLIDNMEEWI